MAVKRGRFEREHGGVIRSAGTMGDAVLARSVGVGNRKAARKKATNRNLAAQSALRGAAGLNRGAVRRYEGVLGQYQQMAQSYGAASAKHSKLSKRASKSVQRYKGLTKQVKRTSRRIKANEGVGDLDRYGNLVKQQGKAHKRQVRLTDKAQLSNLSLKSQHKSLTGFAKQQKQAFNKTKTTRRRYNKLRKRYT
jgi:hypothetical protein